MRFLYPVIFIAVVSCSASAHEHARSDLDSWYSNLKSRKGPCCDGPGVDATHLDDPDWEVTGNPDVPYRVHLPGSPGWTDVPVEAVVNTNNISGRALVWPMFSNGKQAVRCFLPGPMT